MLIFDDLGKIVSVLQDGGIIIYPSDTHWSIGCDAFNEQALKKLLEVRAGEGVKPYILLVSDLDMLKQYAGNIHPRIESLLYYHEKPVTVIYKDLKGFPSILYGDKKSIGIRVVKDRYCQEFIRAFGKPVITCTVNKIGMDAPVFYKEIQPELLRQADYVSLYRRNETQLPKSAALISYNSNGKLKFIDG